MSDLMPSSSDLAAGQLPYAVVLLREDRVAFRPGELLEGVARVALDATSDVTVVVEWHTEGKGDCNAQEIYDRKLGDDVPAGQHDFAFACPLPLMPTTYAGFLIKIFWQVRVVVRGRGRGKEEFVHPFEVF